MINQKFYTDREERANYLSHAVGVIISLIGTYILIFKAVKADNDRAILAYSIFGFGMLACMLSSTIYHYAKNPQTKSFLRHFDHGSIYVLIACSYSPFTLLLLRNEGFWGWGLFILVWLIAFIGIGFNFQTLKANSHIKTASYVLMGLVIFLAIKPSLNIANQLNCTSVLLWIAIGGFFYIVGAVFYALAKREFIHFVFHVFVLLGLVSHIYAAYLIPLK
ncbi:MAG: hemolysin III family protein [Paludibacteraceae bacterium]